MLYIYYNYMHHTLFMNKIINRASIMYILAAKVDDDQQEMRQRYANHYFLFRLRLVFIHEYINSYKLT